ncbi:hypothetical protein DJ031_06770 [bacterium endosymbiont of Escarpia laminata]|nr:MAG: hypothetical protein DJ031_06770 [bacterium endosymbiont of Escarpia laminata]
MRPSTLKTGAKLRITTTLGDDTYTAFFVRRQPARAGRKATNHLRSTDFAELESSDEIGSFVMSDYDLSRRGEIV